MAANAVAGCKAESGRGSARLQSAVAAADRLQHPLRLTGLLRRQVELQRPLKLDPGLGCIVHVEQGHPQKEDAGPVILALAQALAKEPDGGRMIAAPVADGTEGERQLRIVLLRIRVSARVMSWLPLPL